MTDVEIPIDALRAFGRQAYIAIGMAAADAGTVVDVQLDADRRGVDTHGFQRPGGGRRPRLQ